MEESMPRSNRPEYPVTEKIRIHRPKASSPRRCRMKGERKIPTTTFTPRENQLDPTFLRIWPLLNFMNPVAPTKPSPGKADVFQSSPVPLKLAPRTRRGLHRKRGHAARAESPGD